MDKWLPVKMIGTRVTIRMLDGELRQGTLTVARDDCYVLVKMDGKLLHINPAAIGYIEQE